MKLLKIALIFIFTSINIYSYAQFSPEIDSLIELSTSMNESIEKVDILNDICWKLKTKDYDKAIQFANDAIELANKIEYKEGAANGYKNIGGINYYFSI